MATSSEFYSKVAGELGIPVSDEVVRASFVVLELLGRRLSRLEAEALAADLPEELAAALRQGPHGGDFDLSWLHARLAERASLRPAVAVELALGVFRAVAKLAGPGAVRRLRQELPSDFGRRFELPEPEGPPREVHLHPERRTLAEGRPGGRHPLYEAKVERAHSQSVARSDNPHGETKLSSARGLTQEREREGPQFEPEELP